MSINKNRQILLVIGLIFFLTAACSMPLRTQVTPTPDNSQTQAVMTLYALMTEVVAGEATPTPGGNIPTNTAQVATLLPSATPQASNTPVVIPSQTTAPVCDMAGFVADITVPDGTTYSAGAPFLKTWRLKNTGTCTWTPGYAVVFDSGDGMNGPAAESINATVAPGQTVDVSVTLKAPGSPGTYRGYWKLRNAAGVIFGIGKTSDTFYVDIKVVSITPISGGYDFALNACAAEWTGNTKTLPCQGSDGNADGFVLLKKAPILESGYVDDQPALITNPPRVNDGVIRGKYPLYTVASGDHFKSIIGCDYNAKNCNVRFQLDYQIDNGAIKTLASWNELYDEKFTPVDVDLSSLAGSNVRFILTVLSNGASDNDRAQWLLPRID